MRNFLEKLIESEENGYLRHDWQDDVDKYNYRIVETETGYYALREDTITTESGCVYHTEEDRGEYEYDAMDECYREADDVVTVNGHNRWGTCETTAYRGSSEIAEYGGEYYVIDDLREYDLVLMENGCVEHRDHVYYWERDGDYHYDPEDDDDDEENHQLLWNYDSGVREGYFVDEDAVGTGMQWGIGFEIEKSEMPDFEFDKQDVYDETGCVLEKDSSVSEGFELKTATYNLMSPRTDEKLLELKDFCNIGGVENAGGHIGFSMKGKTDKELLDLCSGWLPLIFAMYKKRLNNTYCSGKGYDEMKYSSDKMQAIRMRGNYIEFRLIASVKSFDTLMFRLKFFRVMAKNLGKPFSYVLSSAVTEGSELNTLLTSDIYKDGAKYSRLLKHAIEMNQAFIGKKINPKTLTDIINKINKLTNVCV